MHTETAKETVQYMQTNTVKYYSKYNVSLTMLN